MLGPQEGTGKLLGVGIPPPIAWWLGRRRAFGDETEAAAAPAKTTERTAMRIASFIVGNLFIELN
jgi:hypothetical protein